MATILGKPTVALQLVLVLDEEEARAFDAMVGYGSDAFIKVFYEHLGKSYMQQHEAGLRRLFASVSDLIPPLLSRADHAREAFDPAGPAKGAGANLTKET